MRFAREDKGNGSCSTVATVATVATVETVETVETAARGANPSSQSNRKRDGGVPKVTFLRAANSNSRGRGSRNKGSWIQGHHQIRRSEERENSERLKGEKRDQRQEARCERHQRAVEYIYIYHWPTCRGAENCLTAGLKH